MIPDRQAFITAVSNVLDPASPHGAFLDSCPNQHCQTSTGWVEVRVQGLTMAEAAAAWYFNGTSQKHLDGPFPGNPSCGLKSPMCNNCMNAGLGSNCIYDEVTSAFKGEEQ